MTSEDDNIRAGNITDSITASIVNSVPWLTEPVTEAIRDMSNARRLARIQEALDQVVGNLDDFKSELAELYVKTPAFKQILAESLRAAADEPLEEKRAIFVAFITDAIVSPLDSAEKQLRLINIIKEIKTDHVRLLRAIMELPASQTSHAQSPIQMLQPRVPDIQRDRLEGLLRQMTDLGMTDITDWSATVSGGPEQVRKSVTPIGQRLMTIAARDRQSR